jgi:hypothetical protein
VQQYVVDVLTSEQLQALETIAETILHQLEESHEP